MATTGTSNSNSASNQQSSGTTAAPGSSTGLTDTQHMMHAFGDSLRPNLETAKIVEQVLVRQFF